MFFRVFLCVFLSSFSGEKIPISKKRLFLCVIKKSDLKNIRKKEKCPPNTRRKRNARDYETLSHCSRINPLCRCGVCSERRRWVAACVAISWRSMWCVNWIEPILNSFTRWIRRRESWLRDRLARVIWERCFKWERCILFEEFYDVEEERWNERTIFSSFRNR